MKNENNSSAGSSNGTAGDSLKSGTGAGSQKDQQRRRMKMPTLTSVKGRCSSRGDVVGGCSISSRSNNNTDGRRRSKVCKMRGGVKSKEIKVVKPQVTHCMLQSLAHFQMISKRVTWDLWKREGHAAPNLIFPSLPQNSHCVCVCLVSLFDTSYTLPRNRMYHFDAKCRPPLSLSCSDHDTSTGSIDCNGVLCDHFLHHPCPRLGIAGRLDPHDPAADRDPV